MINQTILLIMQTNCHNAKFLPYSQKLGMNTNFDQENHFAKPLSKIFKNVIRFDFGEAYAKTGVINSNNKIIELTNEFSPKYVIWPTMTYEVLEETFQEIQKLGSYVIPWFFDDDCRFNNYSRWWIPYIDYVFTADKASVARYQQFGVNAYHLPVTGEPEDFKPFKANVNYDVSFIGSRFVADRDNLVKQLRNNGIQISTFGIGWDKGFVSNEEMIEIFNTSKINICFTKSYTGKSNQLKGKIFDITMCGGFLLCEYVNNIEDFFEIGKEIVCFNNFTEALEKINYFIINDEERKRIAEAGKHRATRDLAQHMLLEKVFTAIEIDIDSKSERMLIPASILQLPEEIRVSHAQFHLQWAIVLKKVRVEKKYWQDEFNLAYQYVSGYTRMKLKHRKIMHIISLIRRVRKKLES